MVVKMLNGQKVIKNIYSDCLSYLLYHIQLQTHSNMCHRFGRVQLVCHSPKVADDTPWFPSFEPGLNNLLSERWPDLPVHGNFLILPHTRLIWSSVGHIRCWLSNPTLPPHSFQDFQAASLHHFAFQTMNVDFVACR